MELTHLQTFVVVAEEKSITQAAKRLFTTASSVSVQVKALEDELGVQLFVRTARGMQITDKGSALLTKARLTLASVHDLVNHATEMRAYLMGEVRLGINASLGYLRIPALIQQIKEETPGISLTLAQHASGHVLEHLLSETLDVGFVFGAVNDNRLSARRLETATLRVAAPKAWGLAAADWDTLAHQAWICSDYYCPFQTLVDGAFHERGLTYPTITKTNDDLSKAELVAAGVGLALLEASEAAVYAHTGKIDLVTDLAFPCDLSLVWLHYRGHDPLIQTMIEFIIQGWESPHP